MSSTKIEGVATSAVVAQLSGTIVALFAAGYLVLPLLRRPSELINWTAVLVLAVPPFVVAFACGLCLYRLRKAQEEKVKAWIKSILFADAVLLFFVVYATGGVEGNIFSPIFFVIPVCSVALLKHWPDETRTIFALMVVTIVCHLASAFLHKMWPIAPPFECAPLATWISLYLCLIFSISISVQSLSYANVDASLGVSQKEG